MLSVIKNTAKAAVFISGLAGMLALSSYVLTPKDNTEEAERYDAIAADYVEAYLAAAQLAEPCDAAQKRRKASAYSEGLLEHGGPATDPVKAAMGEEFTAELFRQTLFGA